MIRARDPAPKSKIENRGHPKTGSRSLVKKGPPKNKRHIARVKSQPCIACRGVGHKTAPPSHAHHVRSIGPQGAGKLGQRRPDELCVPLCDYHHDGSVAALHKAGDERAWWKAIGVDPAAWISAFSPEGKAAVETERGHT